MEPKQRFRWEKRSLLLWFQRVWPRCISTNMLLILELKQEVAFLHLCFWIRRIGFNIFITSSQKCFLDLIFIYRTRLDISVSGLLDFVAYETASFLHVIQVSFRCFPCVTVQGHKRWTLISHRTGVSVDACSSAVMKRRHVQGWPETAEIDFRPLWPWTEHGQIYRMDGWTLKGRREST